MSRVESDEPRPDPVTPRPSRRRFLLLAVLLFVGAFGLAVLAVDRRGTRVLAPPPSPAGELQSVAPALPASTVSLEVRYDLDLMRQILDDGIPERFGDLDERRTHPDNPGLSYAVEIEREPLELEVRADTARLTVLVHYRGRAWLDSPFGGEISASCGPPEGGGPRPRAIIRLSSPLEVRPDWRIGASVRVEEVRPASGSQRDRCEVALGAFRMDVTDALLTVAETRIREASAELGASIRALELRPTVESLWHRMQEPIRVGEDAWLQIEPDSIWAGPVEAGGADGELVVARLAVVGWPRIVVGPRPPASRVGLPPLGRGPVEDRFRAILETRIEYETASRMASEFLRGRELTVGGRAVRIEEVDVSGAGGGRLAVGLTMEGAVRGRIHLVGSPALDPETEEVTVPDLRFSVETRNALLRAAAWLVRGTVPERVRRAVRWDASGALARARELATGGLDRSLGDGVHLEGSLGRVEVSGVFADPEALLVRVRLDGTLRIRGTPRSPLP